MANKRTKTCNYNSNNLLLSLRVVHKTKHSNTNHPQRTLNGWPKDLVRDEDHL